MNLVSLLEMNPIIAAVKNMDELNEALHSDVQVIFVLFGDILSLKQISKMIEASGKIGIIHIDLVDGITGKEAGIKYLKQETLFKGVISTKPQIIKNAKSQGLCAILRVFVFDSLSLNNAYKHLDSECDAIEVLPGVIPKVIEALSSKFDKPIVAGGLIATKDEVITALNSGAACVSTTKRGIWNI